MKSPRHAQVRQKPTFVVISWFTNSALNLAAILGLCVLLSTLAGITSGTSVTIFQTGSMAPAIPAGSVAIVQTIRASEISTGDVVTVERESEMPVTHRVQTIREDELGDHRYRMIEMRGDANPVDDAQPYRVDHVQRVLFAVPGLAPVLLWFSHPFVLITITIFATLIVTLAFWPKNELHDRTRRRYSRR